MSGEPPSDTIESLASETLATKFYFCSAFTIVLYDYCLTFGDEVRTIWKKKLSIVTLLFFLNRYYTILVFAVVTGGFFSPLFTQETYVIIRLYRVSIPLLLIPGLLLTIRVWALYDKSKYIAAYLLTLLASQVGLCLWIYASPGHEALPVPNIDIEAFHFCIEIGPPQLGQLTSLYQWTETVFDISIFALTIYKTLRQVRGSADGGLMEKMIKDGALYFAVIFTTNLVWVLMIMFATPGLKYINGMPTLALVSVMMNRITMSLRTTFYGPLTFGTALRTIRIAYPEADDDATAALTLKRNRQPMNEREAWVEDNTEEDGISSWELNAVTPTRGAREIWTPS